MGAFDDRSLTRLVDEKSGKLLQEADLAPALRGGFGGPGILATYANGSLAFAPDGKRLLIQPGLLPLSWALEGNRVSRLGPALTGQLLVAFRPDGKALVAVGSCKGATWWDVTTGKSTDTLPYRGIQPATGALSRDAKVLAVAVDGSVQLWDVAERRKTATLEHSPNGRRRVTSVAFSPDGKAVATGGKDGAVKVWDVASGKLTADLGGGKKLTGGPLLRAGLEARAAFSPDGKYLAAATNDGVVRLWPRAGASSSGLPAPKRPG